MKRFEVKTMRKCLLNDCTGFKGIAPCCRDCPKQCPDRCKKSETTFCVGLIEGENHERRFYGQDNDPDQ